LVLRKLFEVTRVCNDGGVLFESVKLVHMRIISPVNKLINYSNGLNGCNKLMQHLDLKPLIHSCTHL